MTTRVPYGRIEQTKQGHRGEDIEPFDWAYRLDGYPHGLNGDKYISVRPSTFHEE